MGGVVAQAVQPVTEVVEEVAEPVIDVTEKRLEQLQRLQSQ